MHTLQQAIICDLDGTLALMGSRTPFDWGRVSEDTPNAPVVELLRRYATDHAIIVVTGRSEDCRIQTARWLRRHGISCLFLLMRQSNDYRKDAVVKQELYDAHIRDRYEVVFCLDDRDQSVAFWRSLGLACFQVAPGNF